MFVAQIHNKLNRQEQHMEDLLTSNVFGIWRYVAPQLGLRQFLETARDLSGQALLFPSEISEVTLEFWPWIQEPSARGAEPDVLISLVCSNGQRWLILIEAKYLSGKSSAATEEGLMSSIILKRWLRNQECLTKA